MKKIILFLGISACIGSASMGVLTPSAQAGNRFSVAGDLVIPVGSGSSNLSFGGGALFEYGALPTFGFEIGALFASLSNTTQLFVPLLARFTAWKFSVGAGGFGRFPLQGGGETLWGLSFSARYDFFSVPTLSLFVDPRFNLGLTQIAGATYSDVQILLGVALGL